MSPVYHIWIDSGESEVRLSSLSVTRVNLITWLSELNMDWQVELKLGVL